jgi:replication-associated recombination protein RarA
MQLAESTRPRAYADVLGQPRALAALDCVRRLNGGLGGQVFWLAGPSGTGKTTLARLIANEVAGADGLVHETTGGALTVGDLDRLSDTWRLRPMFGSGYSLIVDEAHLLTKAVIGRLLGILEPPPPNVVVVMTTTREGDESVVDKLDGGPLFSRTKRLPMASRGLAEVFAGRLQELAENLGVGGAAPEKYLRAVKDARNNLRACLQLVEQGEFAG